MLAIRKKLITHHSRTVILGLLVLATSMAYTIKIFATEVDTVNQAKIHANNSRIVPFQGQLADSSGKAINGQVRLTFKLYKQATGGIPAWIETHQSISVINGFVNTLLGVNESFVGSKVDFSQPLYLGITVGNSGSNELFPRHQLFPSFHARTAEYAQTASTSLRSFEATTADNAKKLGQQGIEYFTAKTDFDEAVSSLNRTIKQSIEDAIEGVELGFTPVGAVIAWPAGSPPNGWLELNGQEIQRSIYPKLWKFANDNSIVVDGGKWRSTHQGQFSYGNGSTTFQVPDVRGEFIRGWDNGRGADSGRQLGSWQVDAFKSHRHPYTHGNYDYANAHWGSNDAGGPREESITNETEDVGDNETRPRNIAYMYIIYTGTAIK